MNKEMNIYCCLCEYFASDNFYILLLCLVELRCFYQQKNVRKGYKNCLSECLETIGHLFRKEEVKQTDVEKFFLNFKNSAVVNESDKL